MRQTTKLLVLTAIVLGLWGSASAQTNLIGGGLTALPPVKLSPNMVQNPGFETVAGSLPANWTAGSGWGVDQLVTHGGTFSYRWTAGSPTSSQTVQLKKGTYNFSGWVKLNGVSGPGGVRLQLDFRPTVQDWTTTAVLNGTKDWAFYEIRNIVVPQDLTATVKLENYANPGAGTAWFDDIVLVQQIPNPLNVFMLYPNYRGMVFDDQSQTLKFEVQVNDPNPASRTVTGTLKNEGTGQVVATKTFPGAAKFEAQLDGSAMQIGAAYLAEFSVNSSPAFTYPAYRVSKVAAATRATMNISFDDQNRLMIRGQKRFLLGVYDSGGGFSTDPAFWENQVFSATGPRRLEGLPINFYLNYWMGTAPVDAMNALMDVLQKRGIMYLQTGNCFAGGAADPNFAINASDAYVQTFGTHPGSAGYYTADECQPALVDGVFKQYERLRRLDPDSMTSTALFANPALELWHDAADVIGTDPYPLYSTEPAGGYTHKQVADWTDQARQSVRDSRPVITVLQFFKFTSLGRYPTLEEMRSHAYMAIVEGANGLWWWSVGNGLGALNSTSTCSPAGSWCAFEVEQFNKLKAVVSEVAALEPALVADDAPGALTGNSNTTAIRTKVKVVGGKGYVFAYNYTNAPVSATLTWNTAPGTITVNAEGRTLTASGNGFTDSFGPYQAHVYVIANGGTGGTPPPSPSAPTVSFTNPAAGATVNGTVTVTMSATGGSGSGYTYKLTLDGGATPIYTGTNPSFSWNTTSVSNASHTLTATVTDSAGAASSSVTRTVTVSNTTTPPPPTTDTLTLSITAPKPGATVTGATWAVLWLGGTTSTSNTYVLTLGGVEVARTTTASRGPVSIPYDSTKAANGSQTLAAKATDSAGKTGSAQVTVTVANTGTTPPPSAPTVTFTSPAAGATVSGTVTLAVTASGGTGSGYIYTLSVDGTQVYRGATASFALNTTTVPNGSHTLTATVTDSAGTASAPVSRTVTVSNTTTPPPPTTDTLTLSITAPKPGATVSGTAWAVLWLGGTTSTSNTYVLTLGGVEVARTTTASRGPVSIPYDSTKAPNGSQTLAAKATDSAGKTGSTQITVTVSNAGTTPTPTPSALTAGFIAPAAGATVSGTTTVTMSATGGSGSGYTYKLSLDGTPVYSGATASFAWNTTAVANGGHTFALTVTDSAGTASAPVTRTVTVSNTTVVNTLQLYITSPKPGAVVSGTGWVVLWLNGTTSTSNTYTLTVNGTQVAQFSTASRGPVSIPWNTKAFTNGTYTLNAVAKDAAGKFGVASVSITVRN